MKMQLADAVEQSARLNMHITGKNLKQAIQTMDEFESESKKNIRQKYARSNKDLMKRVHAPIEKIFSAKGGSQIINLPDTQLKEYTAYLLNVKKNQSIYQWMQTTGLDGYNIDPNGLLFVEIGKDGKPYPTYKSSSDIFYYELDGRKCNVVIFKLTPKQASQYGLEGGLPTSITDRMQSMQNNTKYFRIVDEVSDKIVEFDGNQLKEIAGLTLPNYFMTCPAVSLSDIYEFDSQLFISPDYFVVELLNATLTQNSIFEIWKNLHMFPKHWTIQSVCPSCEGAGTKQGEDCTDCNGTGYKTRSSVRDELVIAPPESTDGKISLPSAFDGYTTPPIDAWTLATDDMNRFEMLIYFTKWNTMPEMKNNVKFDKGDKTATQVVQEYEGMINALKAYTMWYESTMTFYIDLTAGFMYPTTYKGCSFKGGDRYAVEPPNALWDKYAKSRVDGASQAVLDSQLRDYYEAKFQGNAVMLEIALKQMRVEPFVHLTVQEVSDLPDITPQDKATKVYFSEWKSTLNDMDWITKDDKFLRDSLNEYAKPKVVQPITAGADPKAKQDLEQQMAQAKTPEEKKAIQIKLDKINVD